MKATLILIYLVVLLQVFAAAVPQKGSFVDHCMEKEKLEKGKADKAKVDKDMADKAKKDKAKIAKEKADKVKTNYSEADKHAKKFERESVKKAKTSIPQLGKDLGSQFTDPLLKARAIYAWLHYYVTFDSVPNSTRRSPEEVIIRGIGVSLDYAKLFDELALGAGLDVMYITGHGKGPGYKDPPAGSPLPPFESNHAWNAVKVNGKWQLIDPSYGARVTKTPEKKSAKPLWSNWFESSPEVFRLTHYPEKPEHQFCSDVISWKDFIFPPPITTPRPSTTPRPPSTPAPPTTPAPPAGPLVYVGFKDIGLDRQYLTPNVRLLPPGGPVQIVVRSTCEKPPIKKEDRYLLFVDDGVEVIPMTMEIEGRVWSAVTPPLDPGNMWVFYIDLFEGRDAKGLTMEEYVKAKKEGKHLRIMPIAEWTVEEPDEEADMTEDPSVHRQQATQSNDSDIWDFTCVDYTAADEQGAKFPRETLITGNISIRKLAKDLTSPFTSHILKARAIFTWITTNIVYDASTLMGQMWLPKTAERVVRSGMGSCQGFSEIFHKLAQRAGLDVIFITGAAKGPGYNPPINRVVQPYGMNHMWNAVKLNGRWKPMDTTWGTGRIKRGDKITGSAFRPKFFTATPEVLRRTHFAIKPEEQFCADVMSWDEFCLQERGPLLFADEKNDGGLNLEEVKPNRKRIPAGKPTRFEVKCRCGPIKPEDQYLVFIRANKTTVPLKVGEDGCLWSTVLTPLVGQDVKLVYVSEYGLKSGKGLTMKEYEAPRTGITTTTIVKWEVYGAES